MPRLNPEIQRTLWLLASTMEQALNQADAANGDDKGMKWTVSGISNNIWKLHHPELPTVQDDKGTKKDVLLQLHIAKNPDSDGWFVVAQNNVVGPDTHSTPQALIVATPDEAPSKQWDVQGIAQAAANFFVSQKEELKKRAEAMTPTTPPGQAGVPAAPAGGPMSSRRNRIATLILGDQ